MSKPANGPIIALANHGIEIPPGIVDLQSFRKWARCDVFPVSLEILLRGDEEYTETPCDEQSFRRSEFLGAKVRLAGRSERAGLAVFRLEIES